jgi:hypothetical protein
MPRNCDNLGPRSPESPQRMYHILRRILLLSMSRTSSGCRRDDSTDPLPRLSREELLRTDLAVE